MGGAVGAVTGLDLRAAVPAAVAWGVAGIGVGLANPVPLAIAAWVVASLAIAIGIRLRGARLRGGLLVVGVAGIAAALVLSVVAISQPAREPARLVELASQQHSFGATIELTERALSPPYSARLVSFVDGRARIQATSPVLIFGDLPAGLDIGSRVSVTATIKPAERGDDVAFLLFQHASVVRAGDAAPLVAWANGVRAGFRALASELPGDGGDLLPGLAIGDTSAVGDQLDAAMKTSSLSHLTAVSGANCAVIVGLIMLLGAALGLPRGLRIALSVAVLAAFVVVVTPEPSVLRAAVMAILVLAAGALGRPMRGIPVLSVAVLGLLVTDPWLSRSYGFGLSVLATGALLVVAGPLASRLELILPRWLALVIAVPLAAQLACQPVLILLNPSIPALGVIANVLAEPAAPVGTVLGLLACVLAPVAHPIAMAVAWCAWVPAAWIASVATFFASVPGAGVSWFPGIAGSLALAMITVAVVLSVLTDVARVRRVAIVVVVVISVALAGIELGSRVATQLDRPSDWQVAACDIGQGDAVLVRSENEVALIDTGPDPALLTKCLESLGISRIDLLVLSHFDLDHVGGTSAVYGMVNRAIAGPSVDAHDDQLTAELAAAGASVSRVSRGLTGTLGDLRWRVLWPPQRLGEFEPGNPASVTVLFEGVGQCSKGCLSSLFLGDLGDDAQNALLRSAHPPHVDVVKVAHHGSADQSPALYASIRAAVGVISVGANNSYGHPTATLLDILRSVGTVAVRTDRRGMLLLSSSRDPSGRTAVRVWTERPESASASASASASTSTSASVTPSK